MSMSMGVHHVSGPPSGLVIYEWVSNDICVLLWGLANCSPHLFKNISLTLEHAPLNFRCDGSESAYRQPLGIYSQEGISCLDYLQCEDPPSMW